MKMKPVFMGCALVILLTTEISMATMNYDTANYSLSLVDGCAIDSTAATTNFGTFPVDTAALTGISAGSIVVNCTTGTPYMVGMDDGIYGSGFSPLLNEPISWTFVFYDIMCDGVPLGDLGLSAVDPLYLETNSGAFPVSGVGTSTPKTYTLTANVWLDPSLMLPPGDYSDTVTFTIVW